jgi:hypothetical protein
LMACHPSSSVPSRPVHPSLTASRPICTAPRGITRTTLRSMRVVCMDLSSCTDLRTQSTISTLARCLSVTGTMSKFINLPSHEFPSVFAVRLAGDPPGALRGPLRGASFSPLRHLLPFRDDPPGALRGPLRGASASPSLWNLALIDDNSDYFDVVKKVVGTEGGLSIVSPPVTEAMPSRPH